MAPVLVGGNDEQLKEYFGRLLSEPLMAVRKEGKEEERGWEGRQRGYRYGIYTYYNNAVKLVNDGHIGTSHFCLL